jgi:hypothetical protein
MSSSTAFKEWVRHLAAKTMYRIRELYDVLPDGAVKPLHTCHENEGGWNEEVYFYSRPLIRGVFLDFSWALTRKTSHNGQGGRKR